LGFGAVKIGRNQKLRYAQPFLIPDEREVGRLLNGILDIGINLIDTAPAYGCSETRIGRYLAHRRNEFVLCTKVGETFKDGQSHFDFSDAGVTHSLERSLERLKTDAVDLVLIHSDGNDLKVLNETGVVEALHRAKRQGKTRTIGLSGKTPAGAMAALDWADVLMVPFHREDDSHVEAIAAAKSQGVGVLVKKALDCGQLDPAAALRYVLAQDGVDAAVVGSLSLDHMRKNLAAAAG
jgi:aryl-alcohol dehydrogenase-like predicted oxidoreductase